MDCLTSGGDLLLSCIDQDRRAAHVYVCIIVSVCVSLWACFFSSSSSSFLCACMCCVCICVRFFFIVCQQTLLAPAHAPGCEHCCWTAKQWPCMMWLPHNTDTHSLWVWCAEKDYFGLSSVLQDQDVVYFWIERKSSCCGKHPTTASQIYFIPAYTEKCVFIVKHFTIMLAIESQSCFTSVAS